MKNIKFELINNEGSLYDSVMATSLRTARKYFSNKFSGNYKILDTSTGDTFNVRLS